MLTKEAQVGKKRKNKRKRVPLNTDHFNDVPCFFCGKPATDIHESHRGRNRQLCIDYGMVFGLCDGCHDEVTLNPFCWKDKKLRAAGKKHFEENYPNENFQEVFK